MSGFRLSWNADLALGEIVARVERESGSRRAELVRAEFVRNLRNLSAHPGMGHERPDLTSRSHRFWPVFSYLVVYRPESVPVEVVEISTVHRILPIRAIASASPPCTTSPLRRAPRRSRRAPAALG